MDNKIKEVTMYVCKYCDSVYDSKDMALMHLDECLHNSDDVHTCTTCKGCAINLVAPTDKDNGYNSLRLQNVTGVKAYLTCEDNIYSGKLTEEKILRTDKSCYRQMDFDDRFTVIHTKGYERYKDLMDKADREQEEIDAEILDYHKLVNELKEQDLSEEEVQEILNEKYKEE